VWTPLDEDAGFSSWSSWSPCTKTCTDALDPATKARQRRCVRPPCAGRSDQEKVCNLPQCAGLTPRRVTFRPLCDLQTTV